MTRTPKLLLLTLAATMMLILASNPAEAAATWKWKMQSLWQAGTVNQKVFEQFTERIKKLTNGQLEIEPIPVGTIVGYTETLDAVGAGILDGHHSGGHYFAGKEPSLALTA